MFTPEDHIVPADEGLPHHIPPHESLPTPESVYNWTDDDAAAMSLSGCLSTIIMAFAWLAFYVGNDAVSQSMSEDFEVQTGVALIGLLIISTVSLLGSVYFFGIKKHPQ